MNRIGVVIVTWNSKETIGPCLEAAMREGAEVVVVDNGSSDGTAAEVRRYPTVRLVANTENRGFAAAVNQGIGVLETDLVLLLNPDTVLLTPVAALAEACQDPRVAAAAGRLVDGQGIPQRGFSVRRFPTPLTLMLEALGANRVWPSNPVNRRYRCLDLDLSRRSEVEQPAGAFLMIRRDVWRQLGGMDERFHPLWFEDVDYLLRARRLGYRVCYIPEAAARHVGGQSVRRLPAGCRERYWYGSLLTYAAKHFGYGARKLVCAAVIAGSLVRMPVRLLAERRWASLHGYARVVRLAWAFLLDGRPAQTDGFVAATATSSMELEREH